MNNWLSGADTDQLWRSTAFGNIIPTLDAIFWSPEHLRGRSHNFQGWGCPPVQPLRVGLGCRAPVGARGPRHPPCPWARPSASRCLCLRLSLSVSPPLAVRVSAPRCPCLRPSLSLSPPLAVCVSASRCPCLRLSLSVSLPLAVCVSAGACPVSPAPSAAIGANTETSALTTPPPAPSRRAGSTSQR